MAQARTARMLCTLRVGHQGGSTLAKRTLVTKRQKSDSVDTAHAFKDGRVIAERCPNDDGIRSQAVPPADRGHSSL